MFRKIFHQHSTQYGAQQTANKMQAKCCMKYSYDTEKIRCFSQNTLSVINTHDENVPCFFPVWSPNLKVACLYLLHQKSATRVKSAFTYSVSGFLASHQTHMKWRQRLWISPRLWYKGRHCNNKMLTPRKSFAALKSHRSHISMWKE